MGRRPKGWTKDEVLRVRMRREARERLRQAAEERGVSDSELARQAIEVAVLAVLDKPTAVNPPLALGSPDSLAPGMSFEAQKPLKVSAAEKREGKP